MASPLLVNPSQREERTPTLNDVCTTQGRFMIKARASHAKLPGIRRVPLPAIGIILLIALMNAFIWIGVAIVLVSEPFSAPVVYPCLSDRVNAKMIFG